MEKRQGLQGKAAKKGKKKQMRKTFTAKSDLQVSPMVD